MKNITKLALLLITFLSVTSIQANECTLGEIRIFAGNFAPRNFADANGQLIAISQNQALFSLYGTMYGGDGRTSFGLPDLRGRVPVHSGSGNGLIQVNQGQKYGTETVAINGTTPPLHSHTISAVKVNDNGANNSDAASTVKKALYAEVDASTPTTTIDTKSSGENGDTTFDNRQPSLGVRYIVCTQGLYPSRN